ncbi:ABC transporter permease [Sphingomonas sp. LY160]|uniref:ABC transporter permease n=1 Tax=Sphingomonas sp. LY160 TaxID=3095342 RepID=UPI002ADEE747|nr:ABC transporter permease [Sphingomonas sp. LY160]MEA1072687.1 ABC transporter permease [Sphingomonas sp. LY160]
MKWPETIRAAAVIARRDFTATVLTKTFLLFLLGPLFPIGLGFMFGGIGAQTERNAPSPTIAVISSAEDFALLKQSRDRLAVLADDRPMVDLRRIAASGDSYEQTQRLLADKDKPTIGVLTGGLATPELSGAVSSEGNTLKQVELFVTDARQLRTAPIPPGQQVKLIIKKQSASSLAYGRGLTARAGQALLFLLTILLAGMLLSQLIEEKSNKVIEVLAAAVPVDAIFLGKLFAMLAMSLVGIAVWASAGAVAIGLYAEGGLGALPSPAVGWPAFLLLVGLYFSMSYLLIGSTFLGIGAQASTVREVQTLSMPVTMAQVVLFGAASLGVGRPDSPEAIGAAIFPLSSPFAMIARAAEQEALWPHFVALAWQALWVALIIKGAAAIFRRSVLKSGPSFRWPWQRKDRLA